MEGKKRRVRIALEVKESPKAFESRSNQSLNDRLEKSSAIKSKGNEADRTRMAELLEICKKRGMSHSHAISPRAI